MAGGGRAAQQLGVGAVLPARSADGVAADVRATLPRAHRCAHVRLRAAPTVPAPGRDLQAHQAEEQGYILLLFYV